MAAAIASTLETGGVLVVEAGTGIGKTFSYLVPVLLSGQRTLLSTATKTLQDQLFSRDLPLLVKALAESNHNVSQAARILGISRDTLRYRLEKHALKM